VWFQSDFELHDVEDLFTSSLKVFKSGKYYILRTIIPVCLGKCSLALFDESEMMVSPDRLTDETDVLVILEFKGIRCSARDFHIEIEVKQMMIMKPVQLFANCIIRPNVHRMKNGEKMKEKETEKETETETEKETETETEMETEMETETKTKTKRETHIFHIT
jgi:hypothetical protein